MGFYLQMSLSCQTVISCSNKSSSKLQSFTLGVLFLGFFFK